MRVNCPTPETLAAHAFNGTDSTVARHLPACAACRDEMTWLRETADQLRSAPPGWVESPQCLDEMAIAAFVDGLADTAERSASVAHLVTCSRCRAAVASVGQLAAEAPRTTETMAVPPRRNWWRWRIPIAAAAAVLLVVVWQQKGEQAANSHRGPSPAAQVPIPIAPVGSVAMAETLRWGAVPGIDRYRVTLFDTGGRVLYETELADTVAALPDSVILTPGRLYLWRAEARTDWDRWSPSPMVRFTIATAPPR